LIGIFLVFLFGFVCLFVKLFMWLEKFAKFVVQCLLKDF